MRRLTVPSALLGAALAATAPAQATAQEQYPTTATLYFWFPAAFIDLQNGLETHIERADLIENLEFGFMGEVTHRRGPWLFGGELFYTDVSDDRSINVSVGDGEPDVDSIDAVGDISVQTTMVQGFAGYELMDNQEARIHGTLGLRYASFDTDLDVRTDQGFGFSLDPDETTLDATVGLRIKAYLNDRWSLPVTVDGGAGGSRFTFQMFAGLTYEVGQNGFTVGYRKLEWMFDEDRDYLKRVQFNGPMVAYSRRF